MDEEVVAGERGCLRKLCVLMAEWLIFALRKNNWEEVIMLFYIVGEMCNIKKGEVQYYYQACSLVLPIISIMWRMREEETSGKTKKKL